CSIRRSAQSRAGCVLGCARWPAACPPRSERVWREGSASRGGGLVAGGTGSCTCACSGLTPRVSPRAGTPLLASAPSMATCYRHPSRETGVSCSSCGRPICPDCMTPTPVGMRCPECSKQGTRVMTMRNMAARPRVTFALIAINVLAYLGEEGQLTLSGTSIHGPLIEEGILYRYGVGVEHQYWRLVTSGFLHENLLHIAFNMYLLYLLGMMLEPALGSVKFAAIYFTSLLAGSFGALFATGAPSLGASGAVFGLMG